MMKNLIFLFLFLIPVFVFGQEVDCAKVKNGQFYFEDLLIGNVVVVRNGSKQIEFYEKDQTELEFEVDWIDECTYTLQMVTPIADTNLPEGYDYFVTVEIIEVKENSYSYIISSDELDLKVEDEMEIMKLFD